MLTRIEPKNTYEQAYNNLKLELARQSHMSQVILSRIPDFEFILACINDILTRDPAPATVTEAIDDRIFQKLKLFSEMAPWFVLSASGLQWTPLFNDYITIVITYQDYLEKTWEYEGAAELLDDLRPIITLGDMGAGYLELFHASNIVVQDLRVARNMSSPAMVLSNAYLESLGYYDSQVENQSPGECECAEV